MNGIIYKCVKVKYIWSMFRMIRLFSNRRSVPKKWRKFGWIFLIILTCSLISSNLIRWSCWVWTGWHLGRKWTIKDREDLKAREIIRNLWKNCMGSLDKPNLLKILRIIRFRLAPASCRNSVITYNFSSRKKYNKMTTGKVYQLFLPAQAPQVKASTKSWNSFEQTKIISMLMTPTVSTVLMPTLSC